MKKYIATTIILLILYSISIAQTETESLIQSYEEKLTDAHSFERIDILVELSWLYRTTKPALSLQLAHTGLKEADELNDTRYMAKFLNILGVTYGITGRYDDSFDYHFQSLKIRESINDSLGISASLNNIGLIYQSLNDYEKALEYYLRALEIKRILKNNHAIIISLNNVGLSLRKLGKLQEAKQYLMEALELNKNENFSEGLALSYSNIGLVLKEEKKLNSATDNIYRSLELYKILGNYQGIAQQYNILGMIEQDRKNYQGAINFFDMSADSAKKYGFLQIESASYSGLADIYENLGDNKQSLYYFKLFSRLRDSILNENKNNKILELQMRYESEKNLSRIQTLELEKETALRNFYLVISSLLLLSLILIYWRYRSTRKLNISIEENRDFTNSLLNNLPDYILVHDGKEIIYTNESFENKFGNFKQFTDTGSRENQHLKKFMEILANNISKYFNGNDIVKREISTRDINGMNLILYFRSAMVRYKDKPAILVVLNDITESKRIQKEIIEARDKALNSDKLKSEFLAQVSHEIRTPLNVILSWTNLLKEDSQVTLSQDFLDVYDVIIEQGNRAIRTIDLILNMSELQLGTYEPIKREVDIDDEIIKKLFQEFSFQAKRKRIEFTYAINTKDTTIIVDEYSIYQSFRNLIENALKYTDKGFVKSVVYRDVQNRLCVDISDSGIGISDQILEHIFDPFRQEQQGYSRRFEGTGLGLSLVKNYLKLNSSDVKVVSEKDKGSVFTVIFN